MERPVKERLIGAAVLVAAAIILIPEMLSGRGEHAVRDDQATTEVRSQGGIKTYTIDLNQPPGTAATRVDPEPAPEPLAQAPVIPPVEQPVSPASQAATREVEPAPTPAPRPAATPAPTPRAAPAPTPPPARPAATPAPAPQPARPAAQPAPRTEPARPAAPATTASGWAVQLGSFSKQDTADALVREWRGRGQQAFVMPVRSGSTTLYRVRIGPMQNRAAAEAVLQRVRATVPAAAVVAHP